MTQKKMTINREDVVQDFHEKFNAPVNTEWNTEVFSLRIDLLAEEMKELVDAMSDVAFQPYEGCEAAMLKEMADVQVVLSGLAVTLGLDLDEAFTRVMESNMSKLGNDGKPILRDDGKILKGPNYKEPDLSDLVGKQNNE